MNSGGDKMNLQKLVDFGLIFCALGLVIVVVLDAIFDLPGNLLNVLSILFIIGGVACVFFHNKLKNNNFEE